MRENHYAILASKETIDADVTIAAHAICVRTTMLSLHLI